MTKVTLASVGNIIDATTAAATINSNNAAIVAAVEKTLSRDGTQPNTMTASLDMNSNRILNLAAPVSNGEPARLQDLANVAAGGTVTLNNVPTGGASGSYLTKNTSSNYDMSWTSLSNLFTLGTTSIVKGNTYSTIAGDITWTGTQNFSVIGLSNTLFSTNVVNSGLIQTTGTASRFVNGPSPSADDTAYLAARALAPVSGLLNSHAYRDETVATQNVTGSAFSGYAAFDAAMQVVGTATTPMNHIHGFQSRPTYSSTGHVSEFAGLTAQTTVNGTGIVDNAYGVLVLSPIVSGGGSITNQYAFYSNPLATATNSYFLFGGGVNGTTANPSIINGNVYIGGLVSQLSVEVANLSFAGASRQGWAIADTNAAAGSGTSVNFYRNNSIVGSITTTLTTTVYNTSSDERLKDFKGNYDAKEAIDIIKADPVRKFNWKESGEEAIGWGAQTSYTINTDLATPGNEVTPWGIDKGARTPYLWAAMSDVLNRLEALESKI